MYSKFTSGSACSGGAVGVLLNQERGCQEDVRSGHSVPAALRPSCSLLCWISWRPVRFCSQLAEPVFGEPVWRVKTHTHLLYLHRAKEEAREFL